MRNPLTYFFHLPRNLILRGVAWYQNTWSPDHSPRKIHYPYGFCPRHPTCSMYAKIVIEKHGVVIGVPMALWRVLTCHPWRKPDAERMR